MPKLPPRKKQKGFWNDNDGISARDYLLLLSTSVFFLFVAIGLIMVLFQHNLGKMYLSLLDMVSPVVMTIVGGVFGVQAVESIAKSRGKNTQVEVQPVEEEMNYEEEVEESN